MRSLYEKEWDTKKTLESKANNIVAIAGTTVTLLFGFSTFAKDFLMPSIYFPLYIIMASAISSAISIVISIFAIKTQFYYRPFSADIFKSESKIDQTKIEELKKKNDNELVSDIITNYIKALDKNRQENNKKVKRVMGATVFLISSIVLITIAIIVMVLSH